MVAERRVFLGHKEKTQNLLNEDSLFKAVVQIPVVVSAIENVIEEELYTGREVKIYGRDDQ